VKSLEEYGTLITQMDTREWMDRFDVYIGHNIRLDRIYIKL